MYCFKCGRKLGDGARFCSGCGASLMPDADTLGEKKSAADPKTSVPGASVPKQKVSVPRESEPEQKVSAPRDRSALHIYIISPRLIHKKNIYDLERGIRDQLFPGKKLAV